MINESGKLVPLSGKQIIGEQTDYQALENTFLKLLKVSGMSPTELVTFLEPVKADDPYAKAGRATEIKSLSEKSGIAIDVIKQLQSKLGNPVFRADILIKATKNAILGKSSSNKPQQPSLVKPSPVQDPQHQRAIQEAQRRLQERRRLEEMGGLL